MFPLFSPELAAPPASYLDLPLPAVSYLQALAAQAVDGDHCAADQKLVLGTHHEYVQRLCLDYHKAACWSYHPGLVALEPRATAIRVCIDEYEWPNEKGASPPVMMSFSEAQKECAGVGKRLCTEFEWELACEGAGTQPYPYGWAQEPGACVNDKKYKFYDQAKLESRDRAVRSQETKRLYQAEPSGSRPRCTSPFGAVDLVGNVEEWVTTSRPEWPHVSSLKGGYWARAWSGCRGTNDSHGPAFRFYDIGFRCCSDPSSTRR